MAGENKIRPKGLKAKLENFWYHYKYFFLSGVFLFTALVIVLFQCVSRPNYDYYFVIVTDSVELAPSQIQSLSDQLSSYGEDLDGDGEVAISLIDCSFNKDVSSYQMILAKKQKLQSVIMNEGDALIYITEKSCLEWINTEIGEDFFVDLNLSEEDGRYFSLEDTELIKTAKELSNTSLWPENLLISRRKIKDTLIENTNGVEKARVAAEKYINKLISENN